MPGPDRASFFIVMPGPDRASFFHVMPDLIGHLSRNNGFSNDSFCHIGK